MSVQQPLIVPRPQQNGRSEKALLDSDRLKNRQVITGVYLRVCLRVCERASDRHGKARCCPSAISTTIYFIDNLAKSAYERTRQQRKSIRIETLYGYLAKTQFRILIICECSIRHECVWCVMDDVYKTQWIQISILDRRR